MTKQITQRIDLNTFQEEAIESIQHKALASVFEAIDPEGIADLGGHFGNLLGGNGNALADKLSQVLKEILIEAEEVVALEVDSAGENKEVGKVIAQGLHRGVCLTEGYDPALLGNAIADSLNTLCLNQDPKGVDYENMAQGAHLVLVYALNKLVKNMEKEGVDPLI